MVTALQNEGFKIRNVDLRSGSDLIEKHQPFFNPTYVYVVNGEEVRRGSGDLPVDTVRNMYRVPLF